ncbi:MAG: sensor histidine kinase, partial [Anaerolineaceae bacterium]|nr:sensor histidine kinase [Anaerolineaceae bacterium]
NLLENGILYNHPGGVVQISSREDQSDVVVEVCDDGLGISQIDQTKIFDRFYRSNMDKVNRPSGKGLGLAIVKHIIELHHGRIEVESELGVGSTFRLYIPSNGPQVSQ